MGVEMIKEVRTTEVLLTVPEVATLLHIHCNTVRRWSDQGIIKAYRISARGDRRFKREDVYQFLTHFEESPNVFPTKNNNPKVLKAHNDNNIQTNVKKQKLSQGK
jgi:excisionase family DNA binding protein